MENELISRSALEEKYIQRFRELGQAPISENMLRREEIKSCIAMLNDAPSVIRTRAVSCGECIYPKMAKSRGVPLGTKVCGNPASFARGRMITPTDFCPYGERRCE